MISAADILKANILIVDDQAANVVLLTEMLQVAGYLAIDSTGDPRAVCALHRSNRYCLILLDLQMPQMNGFEVMAALTEVETEGYLPVLVLTSQPGHSLRALKAGAKDFVSKPFDLPEVLMRVRNMIEVRLLHRDAEQRMERAEAQTQQFKSANLAKNQFLATMSHELRTPLNGIIGYSEFLIDEKPGPLKPKQKEYLGDVLNSARHLLQLINDILDLAKVDAGKMEFHPRRLVVAKAVAEVAAVVNGIAIEKSVGVKVEIGPGVGITVLDEQKFKQVLYNLLSNAVKFTETDGTVAIRVLRLDAERLEVQVRDTGIGIRTTDLTRLFAEFEQLDSSRARRFEGSGLGLALTKRIVEAQGGAISVESEFGRGSAFTVVLPAVTASEETR